MGRYHQQVDLAQSGIVKALREEGATVTSIASLGSGVPDLLVSFAGRWFIGEVKTGSGKLTPKEAEWHAKQQAPIYIWRTPQEAVSTIKGHLERD